MNTPPTQTLIGGKLCEERRPSIHLGPSDTKRSPSPNLKTMDHTTIGPPMCFNVWKAC